jgi:hypothetical protein
MSKADTNRAAGFDPPLVRGSDGEYYFAILGRDEDGEVQQFYLPAPAAPGWLTVLEWGGKRSALRFEYEDRADPRTVRGKFVAFRAFRHALVMEGSYRGSTIYIPVSGGWYHNDEDPGRYVFAIRAAKGEPDSRFLRNWTLDSFLVRGQTYHYKTRRELNGGSGSNALFMLGGLALLAGWWFSIWGLGITLGAIAGGYNVPVGTLASVALVAAPTIGATAWLARRWFQEKSPYHLDHVPDVTLPGGDIARQEGNLPRSDESLQFYS